MRKRTRMTVNSEFRLEASQLVVDPNYTVRAAAQAMSVGISTMAKWVPQLKLELHFKPYVAATPMTPDQLEIREFEMVKEILKKATALVAISTGVAVSALLIRIRLSYAL